MSTSKAAREQQPDSTMQWCLGCGSTHGIGMTVHCPRCGNRAFLRTSYAEAASGVPISGPVDEFTSYRAWLPFELHNELPSLRIGCIEAPEIAASLGLGNLWLLISGYVPDLGATLPTCTFKTLEAVGVMERVQSYSDKTLILSSAGNAGTAILEFGARWQVPAIVIVPESAAGHMYTTTPPDERSPLLICLRGATYLDAITMVTHMIERFGDRLVREGGAFNVARRDSMGVPVLRAAQSIGRIPDHYFQAVGSGTGGIAAHEASLRLASAGMAGGPMRLHLVQNSPFTPMVDAWNDDEATVPLMPRAEVLERVGQTYTSMLSNARPPYSVRGGVRDILKATRGAMYAVSNDEARAGTELVERHHGFVPQPEAGAAMAGLIQAAERGTIGADDVVLVHLTGAGLQRSIDDLGRVPYPAQHTLPVADTEGVASAIASYLDRQ